MGWFKRKPRSGTQKRSREMNPLFLSLFGLPFLGVGIGMTVACGLALVEANGLRAWEEVPATILTTEIESHSDSEGGSTYRVAATYRYEWRGKKYSGNRVGIHGGADNIGSFHREAYSRLEFCRANGRTVPCYVNPANPSESILFREVRWEMLAFQGMFALVFGSAGLAMVTGGAFMRRGARQRKALVKAHPDEPWLWNGDWSGGEVRSSNRTVTLILGGVAAYWNLIAISVTVPAVLDGFLRDGNRLALLALIFPAIGLLLAWAALAQYARLRRFGESVFKMTPFPGLVGGKVSSVVNVPVHLRPEDGFLVTLRCQRTYDSGDSTATETLCEMQRKLARELLERDLKRSAIPILFTVPYVCQPTDEDARISWHLQVKARTDQGKYESKFEIPVFRTAESSEGAVADESAISAFEDKGLFKDNCAANRIVINELTDGGREFVFPSHLAKSMAGFVICAVAVAGAAFARHVGGPWPLVAGIGLVGTLVGGLTAGFWLRPSRVTVRRGTVTIWRSVVGFAFERTMPAQSVLSVEVGSNTQSGDMRYYVIRMVVSDGGRVVAACALRERAFVEELAVRMGSAIEEAKR